MNHEPNETCDILQYSRCNFEFFDECESCVFNRSQIRKHSLDKQPHSPEEKKCRFYGDECLTCHPEPEVSKQEHSHAGEMPGIQSMVYCEECLREASEEKPAGDCTYGCTAWHHPYGRYPDYENAYQAGRLAERKETEEIIEQMERVIRPGYSGDYLSKYALLAAIRARK